jgi:hypothetical protein
VIPRPAELGSGVRAAAAHQAAGLTVVDAKDPPARPTRALCVRGAWLAIVRAAKAARPGLILLALIDFAIVVVVDTVVERALILVSRIDD